MNPSFWVFFLIVSSPFALCSDIEADAPRDFVPLPNLNGEIPSSTGSATAAATDTPPRTSQYYDEIFMDESVSISIDCEKSLGSSEEVLKSFVMKSLDFSKEETFADLERPACRAFFDRNGHYLSKEQLATMLASERGRRIINEAEVLEFFQDFNEFTLQDFHQFPHLKVGKIRNVSSISGDVLLALIKQQGYAHAGRLERLPEKLGDRVLEHEAWKLDPEIWQLFTLEGIAQVNSLETVEKFALFLAGRAKFERLISSSADTDTDITAEDSDVSSERPRSLSNISYRSMAPSSQTLTPVCKNIAKHADLLARWAVQSEELMLYLIDISELGGRNAANHLAAMQNAVRNLLKTREWLKGQMRDRCSGAQGVSEAEMMRLSHLKAILKTPLAWRLKEALRLHLQHSGQTLNPADTSITPMTRALYARLAHFPAVLDFYRSTLRNTLITNDQLLTHFFLVNRISDLAAIFQAEPVDDLPAANEKLLLAVALRRILLLLLSPSLDSSNVIQDALNYVFSSTPLATSDSNEIVRWFRQAQDLHAIPVLDRLIRNFGHEFDVSQEIRSMLTNRAMRMRLFTEAQSSFVRLLVALSNGLSELLLDEAPKILILPYIDPANALLKIQVPALPVHPSRRPHTPAELAKHQAEIDQVRAHNAAIADTLQASLRFLKSFELSYDIHANAHVSPNFAGFLQANFRIQFTDNVGVDAGGLRRTWLSALLRIFGDTQRLLFPQHVESDGRVPAALLDPEIMGHLGALHGKALQIGVKPDWFFNRHYTQSFLFTRDQDDDEVTPELLELTESLYPEIFGVFESILQIDNEAARIEYFNASEFPSIAGLTDPENLNENAGEHASENESEDSVDNPPQSPLSAFSVDNESENVRVDESTPLLSPLSPFADDSGRVVEHDTQSHSHPLHLSIQPPNSPAVTRSPDSDDDSVTGNTIPALADDDTVVTIPQTQALTQSASLKPPRHSFSRMLVFDVRYLTQPSIYSGPRATIHSLADLEAYRTALLHLFAQNLLAGRRAYTRALDIFFDTEIGPLLSAQFLHELLEPPAVSIEEIMTRVQFHRSCDVLNLIDDDDSGIDTGFESGFEGDNEHENYTESKEDTLRQETKSPNKKQKLTTLPLARKLTNISARTALTRILSSSFTSQSSISALLSFSTGCPQIPPAGLDALRISIHCYPATSRDLRLSKSHTCSNTIDFMVSMQFKETREAFLESVLSSSGFGFS